MGRLMGIEPMHAGATIQCVNRFTKAAMSFINRTREHVIHEFYLCGNYLLSHVVSNQVLSTYECLTTVFGMGTGGSTQLSPLDFVKVFVAPSKLYRRLNGTF